MSETRTAATCEPAPAEHVRSVLAVADSVGVMAGGAREDIMAGVGADFDGTLLLHVPADSHTVTETLCAPPVGVPAVLEWTDLAPVPVRDRVRARVRVTARLHAPEPDAGGTVLLRADVRQVAYICAGTTFLVSTADLAGARPDPVARAEARLLLHLAEDHQDHVEALAALLSPRDLLGVTRVTPLALDRYGIVLRLEHHRRHCDARLAFARPLSDPEELGHRIHGLLAHAHRHRRLA